MTLSGLGKSAVEMGMLLPVGEGLKMSRIYIELQQYY
jgi:hypothetical protein